MPPSETTPTRSRSRSISKRRRAIREQCQDQLGASCRGSEGELPPGGGGNYQRALSFSRKPRSVGEAHRRAATLLEQDGSAPPAKRPGLERQPGSARTDQNTRGGDDLRA